MELVVGVVRSGCRLRRWSSQLNARRVVVSYASSRWAVARSPRSRGVSNKGGRV